MGWPVWLRKESNVRGPSQTPSRCAQAYLRGSFIIVFMHNVYPHGELFLDGRGLACRQGTATLLEHLVSRWPPPDLVFW